MTVTSKKTIAVTSVADTLHSKTAITEEVNKILESYYARNTDKASKLHPRFGTLLKTMHTHAMSGGKRLRPYLAVFTYEAYGGNQYQDMCMVGAALELLHNAMLIHDDIIDRDYVRYGVDNIAGQYRRTYSLSGKDSADILHYANSTALLAGDINLSASYQLILASHFSADQKILAQRLLSEAIFQVIGGELIDTDSIFYERSETNPITVAEIKTAHYSFTSPLLIGATLAGANEDELQKLTDFSKSLGIAFQLRDDLLGVFGDEGKTGKSTVGDIQIGRAHV